MKKILLLAALFVSLQNFAQKTFEIYNYTGSVVKIADLATDASGTYPEFHSKPSGLINIAPGATYTLVNASNVYRFPLYSPTTSPAIPTWERMTGPTVGTNMPSNVAWTLANAQVFKQMNFYVGSDYALLQASVGSVSGSGWTALYDVFVDPVNPNIIVYTIVIF